MSSDAGLHYAFRRAHEAENDLASELLDLAAQHRTDHEVHHVARDLASWSEDNVRKLAETAAEHQLSLDAEADEPGPLRHLPETMATLVGRRPEAGLLLLEQLRKIYLLASTASLAWEMLAQHAQAKHETDILALTEGCHPLTLRTIRWANTMIKTLSPQVLTSL
jgi:NAD(P)-dependent dehydrogenase (short-subunit alcohol dehydrogenase family)